MIRFFEKCDRDAVMSLWAEAFGDSRERISDFLDSFCQNMLVFEKEGRIASMVTILEMKIGAEKGRYIYALATDKRFRGQGLATELIEYVKRFLTENGEKFLILLPQSKSLYDFYEKRGFSKLFCTKTIQMSDLSDFYGLDVKKITAKDYFKRRKEYFKKERYAEWDIKMLEYMRTLYNGEFVSVEKDGKLLLAAFCHKNADKLIVSELLSYYDEDEVICGLAHFFTAEEVLCLKAEKTAEPFAMAYPSEYADVFFGLGMNF